MSLFDVMNDVVLATFAEAGCDAEPTVTIRRDSYADLEVAAIFDSRHYAVDLGTEPGSSLITSVTLSAADAALVTGVNTRILARGETWRATDKKPDGQGFVVVTLEGAPDA